MQDHNNPVRFRNIWFLEGVKAPEKSRFYNFYKIQHMI